MFNTTDSARGDAILLHLAQVQAQRDQRARAPALAARVTSLKHYQQSRFEHTYPDLLADARYAGAARFFLDELYGPTDFSQRDAQFARIVPALVRLFPHDIVHTVEALAAVHALSERLDTAMAEQFEGRDWTASSYRRAWQALGERPARQRQIELILDVGRSLDVYTRNPLLRHTLRLMRAPAKAAGLSALQQFLENGFDTFRAMRGADVFLRTIAQREQALLTALFDADGDGDGDADGAASVQLP
jgi:hypothetical protein